MTQHPGINIAVVFVSQVIAIVLLLCRTKVVASLSRIAISVFYLPQQ